MLKRKLQDLTACCSYQINFLHQKAHSAKEFRRQYHVLEEIGRGGFGIVYKAIRCIDGLPVAVKFVEHKHVREWTMTCNQLIPSEVCHLETCKDVIGVVQLIDWFANSKGFLIVMERPSTCMDVFDLVSTYGRLDESTARGIFLQVVDTVCDMYAKHGLIHRDIKDENLIVNMDTGEVKLVDFGATTLVEKALKKEFQGTRSYCPPEWFRQLQYLPLEATSWSLGVLLYILVTGQLPFKNEIQICLGRVKFPSYLSKECCQLIKSCLTTAAGSRAALLNIRQHPWLNQHIEVFNETFQEVLDRTLGRSVNRSPRITAEEGKNALEEERQINDIIIVDDSPIICSSTKEGSDERNTTITVTSLDSQKRPVKIERLHSRYDNISPSSLSDYCSLVSLDRTPENPAQVQDALSIATTNNLYYSANDINENDDNCEELEECSINAVRIAAKSVSAYNLTHPRKRSMVFKSFDRGLDTVLEHSTQEHLANAMLYSKELIANDPNTIEETVLSNVTRMSRHRPLRLVTDVSSLTIFETQPRATVTTVV